MTRVFLDTSVLFAAAISSTGASREIINMGLASKLTLVLSDYVIEEMRAALERKAPDGVSAFDAFLQAVDFENVRPSKEEALAAAEYTELKDAPIVAAAVKARADYLVSLDRKHLVGRTEVEEGSGLRIVLPGELLDVLRSNS